MGDAKASRTAATLARWVAIGVIPQLTLWVAVTVVLGLLVAVPAAILARLRDPQRARA